MRPPIDIELSPTSVNGTASPLPGVITSFKEQIQKHLRIASLVVGVAVGALSLIGQWRKLRGRRRNRFLDKASPRAGGLG